MTPDEPDERPGAYASPPCFLHEIDPAYSGLPAVDARQAQDVARWRKAERARLRAARPEPGSARKTAADSHIMAALSDLLQDTNGAVVGWYWPIQGEPDLLPLMRTAALSGRACALPAVVEKARPLAYRRWTPDTPMQRGVWNIPVPAGTDDAAPDIVLAPLVGFDPACFRLGNGGGYFDRTLAALPKRVIAIGVGYAAAAIPTIYPQWHDIPMRCIVTEQGVRRPAAEAQTP